MSRYKITLNGLEELAKSQGYSLFDNILLPEGIDTDILIPTIFMRANEFEVLYADPEYVRGAVNIFFKRYYETFSRLLEVDTTEYDPIENYDRHEEYSGSDSGSGSGNSSNTNTNQRAGFNSSAFENYDKDSSSGNSSSSYSNQNAHTSHIHGNIGVTTSVAMLFEHIRFWEDYNTYDAIADLFVQHFCILVY